MVAGGDFPIIGGKFSGIFGGQFGNGTAEYPPEDDEEEEDSGGGGGEDEDEGWVGKGSGDCDWGD
jgi:hypothetical protein